MNIEEKAWTIGADLARAGAAGKTIDSIASMSIAISLKRIADALAKSPPRT